MQEATACDLVMCHGTSPLTIAKGIVHPPQAGAQLVPHHLIVSVDMIVAEWAVRIPLPVPTEGMAVLDDARHEYIQWPKSQIILDQVTSK